MMNYRFRILDHKLTKRVRFVQSLRSVQAVQNVAGCAFTPTPEPFREKRLERFELFTYDSNLRIAGMRQATREVRTMTMAPMIATVAGAPRKCAEVPANKAPSGMKPRSSM